MLPSNVHLYRKLCPLPRNAQAPRTQARPPCRSVDSPSRTLCVEEGPLEGNWEARGRLYSGAGCTAQPQGAPLTGPQGLGPQRPLGYEEEQATGSFSEQHLLRPPKPSALSQPISPPLRALGSSSSGWEPVAGRTGRPGVPGPSPSTLPGVPRGKLSLPRTGVHQLPFPRQRPDLPSGVHSPAATHAQGRAL